MAVSGLTGTCHGPRSQLTEHPSYLNRTIVMVHVRLEDVPINYLPWAPVTVTSLLTGDLHLTVLT